MKIYSVGIIGAGYVSSYHLRALESLKNVHIVGISDQDPLRGAKVAGALGSPSLNRLGNSTSELPR